MTWEYTDYESVSGSSSVCCMWYNRNTQELAVEFWSGDNIYGWKNVSEVEWEQMLASASVGSYVARNIKGVKIGFLPNTDLDGDFEKVEEPTAVSSVPASQAFVVRGTEPFEVTVYANSLEEAVAQVKDGNENVTVTSVTVNL